MSGIAAIAAYGGTPVVAEELGRIGAALAPVGAAALETWIAPDAAAGLAGPRVWADAEGALRIALAGTLLDVPGLHRRLGAAAPPPHAPPEAVLAALYRKEGPSLVRHLRGAVAFALWDASARTLLLARDPLGAKPLYWGDDGGCVRASTRVKALAAAGGVHAGRDPAGRAGFFLWGYVPEPLTLLRGVVSLAPGSSLQVGPGGPAAPACHWDARALLAAAEAAPTSVEETLAPALAETVATHLQGATHPAVLLSAGLDSATLAAFAADADTPVAAFTLGARDGPSEIEEAADLAQSLGLAHAAARVDAGTFRAAHATLLADMDQPSIDGVNMWLLARATAAAGHDAALAGIGGDEIFGAYPGFAQQVPRLARRLAPFARVPALGRTVRRATAPLLRRTTSPKYAGLLEYGGTLGGAYLLRRGLFMPWELPFVMPPDEARAGLERLQSAAALAETTRGLAFPPFQATALELAWHMRGQLLRDADWAGWAHGLEIRAPLADARLLETLAPLLAGPARPTKRAMGAAAGLPRAVLDRPKTGFVLPVRDWLADAGHGASGGASGGAGGGSWLGRGLRGWARAVDAHFHGEASA